MAGAVIAMCTAPKTRINDNLLWATLPTDIRYDIPDNALDRHTRRGRSYGRGVRHWVEEGVGVWPPSDELEPLDSDLRARCEANLLAAERGVWSTRYEKPKPPPNPGPPQAHQEAPEDEEPQGKML